MNVSDRDDRAPRRVRLRQDPKLIGRDDRNAAGEESTTDGYGFADSREDLGPRPLKSLKRLLTHDGRQLSWYCRRVRHGGVLTVRV